jgi:hypothetical protein
MEKFKIDILKDNKTFHFEVADYLHHDGEQCKFEVFLDGNLVASFEPDAHEYLRVCKNPGNLDEEILHIVAHRIEASHL